MSNLHRESTISTILGNYLAPGAGFMVNAYAPGAVASGTETVNTGPGTTTIPVYDGTGFVANEFAMKGLDTGLIFEIVSVDVSTPGSNTITVDGELATSDDGDVFFNIGRDTGGGGAPTFVQTGTPNAVIYDTPDTSQPIDDSKRTCDSGGNYDYYYDVATSIWELVRNTSGTPEAYFLLNTVGLQSSASPSVNNHVVRWDGTTGQVIKDGYSSNPVSITDDGDITAAGTHTLGNIIVAGGVNVSGGLTIGGNVVLGDAVGDSVTIAGTVAIGSTLTVTGATTLAATSITSTLSVTGLATFTTGARVALLSASLGGTPTVGTITNFGTSPVGSILATYETGTNTRCTVNIRSGTGTGTNPGSFVLNYGTTYSTVPWVSVVQNVKSGGGAVSTGGLTWVPGLSSVTVSMNMASAASLDYVFHVLVIQ